MDGGMIENVEMSCEVLIHFLVLGIMEGLTLNMWKRILLIGIFVVTGF